MRTTVQGASFLRGAAFAGLVIWLLLAASVSWPTENPFGHVDPLHNPWDTVNNSALEPYWKRFISSRNERETNSIALQIRFLDDEQPPKATLTPIGHPDNINVTPDELQPGHATFKESLDASLIANAWRVLSEPDYGPVDPLYNPWDTINGTDLEPYWERFASVRNAKETDAIALQIRQENKDRKTLLQAGWTGIATSFVARLVDPAAAVLAVLAAFLIRAWWHIPIAALLIGGIVELTLFKMQLTRSFDPLIFLVGLLAAGVWIAVGYFLRRGEQR